MESQRADRRFGASLAALCVLVALAPLLRSQPPRYPALIIAMLVLAGTALRPRWFAPARRLTHRITTPIQAVTSPVILGLIYFGIFAPGGFLMRRAFRTDPLRLRRDPAATTYWNKSETERSTSQAMPDQF